jgi:branched-chain amino acid transport system ATP-binding protein
MSPPLLHWLFRGLRVPSAPVVETTTLLLEVKNLRVDYGKIKAVKGVDLEIQQGEHACLIGANGAGKTSLLKAIAGLVPSRSETISFLGSSLTHLLTHERVDRGIALVPEGRGIFLRLSVRENLEVGGYIWSDTHERDTTLENVLTLLPRLRERLSQKAGTLSGGEQQMLAIGRALLSRPRLLLLDEPSMGLAPVLVDALFDFIEGLTKTGTSLLLVEQKTDFALSVASRVYVMERGEITLSGCANTIRADPALRRAYLGE